MAVALRRQEFELQELDSLSLIAPGLLTRAFFDTGANDPFFAGLKAIPGGGEPVLDDNGLPLDTTEKLERFHVVDSAYIGERHANRENFGYNIKELEIEPSPVKGSGPNDPDYSTNAGRLKLVASSTLHADAETKKRNDEFQFLMLLQDIRDEGEYLRTLMARIAEIDKRLEQIQANRSELQEIEDMLNAGDMQYGATPAERRANRLRVAGRLGLDTLDGNISDESLDRIIREEIARRREDVERERREEQELRRERDQYQRELDAYNKRKSPEAIAAAAPTREQFIRQEVAAVAAASPGAQPISEEQIKAASTDLNAALAMAFTMEPEENVALTATAQEPEFLVAAMPAQTPETATQFTQQPAAQIIAAPAVIGTSRVLGSFADEIGTGTVSSNVIALNTVFTKATSLPSAETLPVAPAEGTIQYAQAQNRQPMTFSA